MQPKQRRDDTEILDDSEEENRLTARHYRRHMDQASQTDGASWSFCCGVCVGVLLIVFALSFVVLDSDNDRHRMVK